MCWWLCRYLGSPPYRGAHQCHAQLGDGAEEVVSCLQDPHLLWQPEGTQAQATGLFTSFSGIYNNDNNNNQNKDVLSVRAASLKKC